MAAMRSLRRLAQAGLLLGGALPLAEGASQPAELTVVGATTDGQADVNGLYKLTDTETEGHKCYKMEENFDCHAGEVAGWSGRKKIWCCDQMSLGCELESVTPPAPAPMTAVNTAQQETCGPGIEGADFADNDIRSTTVSGTTDAELDAACCAECTKEPACKLWVRVSGSSGSKTCWLKKAKGSQASNSARRAGEMSSAPPVAQLSGTVGGAPSGTFLCQHGGGWWISSLASIETQSCYYYTSSQSLPPTGTWKTCKPGTSKMMWHSDPSMRVVALEAVLEADPLVARPEDATPLPQDEALTVSGTPSTPTSNGELVNGEYIPTTIMKNEHKCWRKADQSDFWICMGPYGYWLIQPHQYLGQAKGYIISTERYAAKVAESGPFQLYNGVKFEASPTIKIDAINASTAKLSWTAALTALCALVTILVTLSVTLSDDPRLRSYMYRFISCSLTIFTASFFVQAWWDFFRDEDSPYLPRATTLIETIVGFIAFTLVYGCIPVLGWKFMYSHPRMYALKTLGAHIAAFVGIMSFTVIQRKAVEVFPEQLVSSVIHQSAAEIITAVGVLLFAWCFLHAYRLAIKGFREDYEKKEPKSPWSTKDKETFEETDWPLTSKCLGRVSKPLPLAFECTTPHKKTVGYLPVKSLADHQRLWILMVEEAEEEVSQLIMSFLLNQTMIYLLTKQIPGLEGKFNAANIDYWWAVGIVFLLVAVGLIMIRNKTGDGTREGRILQLSMALAASWALFRLANCYLELMYPTNAPLSIFASACVITCVSMLLMFAFDKAAGRTTLYKSKTPSGHDSLYSLKYTFALCFGNITGLAWDRTIHFAVHASILGSTSLASHPKTSELLITTLIALFVTRCWYITILPKAEMTEDSHEELMMTEQRMTKYPNSFPEGDMVET